MLKMKNYEAYWIASDDFALDEMLDNGHVIVKMEKGICYDSYLIARDNLAAKDYYNILKENGISYPYNALLESGIVG